MLSLQQRARLRRAAAPGQRLRLAMDALELTQEQVEAGSGVGQGTISKILRGERPDVMVSTAHKLAAFFGCEIGELFPPVQKAA